MHEQGVINSFTLDKLLSVRKNRTGSLRAEGREPRGIVQQYKQQQGVANGIYDTTFYLDKDRDFLEKELHTKLEVLSGYIAKHILNTWRRTPTHYDANSPYLHDHDIITILQFIDRYPVEKFASAYQNVFKEYIREIIDCGGWIQMINHWDEDPVSKMREKSEKIQMVG